MNVVRFNRLLKKYKYSREAVKELYEYCYPLIMRYIKRQFRGKVDGQDVAQQFFLKLFNTKSKAIRAPDAWIHTVARNIAIDMLRKSNRQSEVEMLATLPEQVNLPEDVSDMPDGLEETEKKIVYLKYWEKYTLREISEILAIKYGSVKYMHGTAKKKLKRDYLL